MSSIGSALQGNFTVYHGTDARFERFSLDYAARPGMHSNGHLGVWLAVDRELAQGFGSHCLEVAIQVDKAYVMSVTELRNLCNQCHSLGCDLADAEVREHERTFFTSYREGLLKAGYDTVYLQEIDGRVAMVIGLAPERLAIQRSVV